MTRSLLETSALPCLGCTFESHETIGAQIAVKSLPQLQLSLCGWSWPGFGLRSPRRVPVFAVSPPEHTVAAACHPDLWQKPSDTRIIGLSEKEDHFIESFLLRLNWD